MTPEAVRIAWIAGLAAAGAAVVGAVAYASSAPTPTPTPTLPLSQGTITTKPTAVPIKQGAQPVVQGPTTVPPGTPPPSWQPPPAPPNSQQLTLSSLGQTGMTAQPTAGQTLWVVVPPGVSVTTASVMADPLSGQGAPGTDPTFTPSQASLYGNGGAISIVLSGAPGYLVITGINADGQAQSVTVQIGTPSSPTPPIGGV